MLAPKRAGGLLVVGLCCVHELPSQVHVSSIGCVSAPPKSTSMPVTPSRAMLAPLRAGGLAAGIACDQVAPSQGHVSPRYVLPSGLLTCPPKRTICLLAGW